MSTASKIEWTDTTWNPLAGCTPVSPGCRNCYAANHARRLAGNPNRMVAKAYKGTARTAGDGRAVFTGRVNLLHDRLEEPLHWRKPRRVFVNAMSDLFHPDVPFDFVDRVFAVMALSPQHTYQVLTKRPDRMAKYLGNPGTRGSIEIMTLVWQAEILPLDKWPLPNVWLGTSVENQAAADERIPHFLRCRAAVRFLSCEPLLGPVELSKPPQIEVDAAFAAGLGASYAPAPLDHGLHWIIVGGESGPKARPCDINWVRSLVRQGQAAGVPVFVKQFGARPFANGTATKDGLRKIRDRKGGDPSEWPEDLRVREFPQTTEVGS